MSTAWVSRCRTTGCGWNRKARKVSVLVALVLSGVVVSAGSAWAQGGAAPEITSGDAYTVREGTTAVATLAANDDDTAASDLAWSKTGGADTDKFSLSAGGVLAFSAAKDYENPDDDDGDGVYEVTVQVSDGTNTDTADISVTLQNVIELTAITGLATVSFPENTATRAATFTASSDADRDGVEWTLTGDDAARFSIDSPPGALRFDIAAVSPKLFAEPPDFESPADTGTDNDYEVTLQARVGTETSATFDVTITVTDADEPGTVTFSTATPAAGQALTATLSDPDGVTANTTTWKWERSVGRNRWAVIDGATSAVYTPTAADTNAFLRATATYDDEHGTGHTAGAVALNVVTGPRLAALSATTDDSTANTERGLFPAFSSTTLHYGIGCETTTTMTLTPAAASGARVTVGGVQVSGSTTVAVGQYSDVSITVSDASGAHTVYVVHCLTDVFFDYTTTTTADAAGTLDGMLLFGHADNLIIMDYNGVPRFRRSITDLGTHDTGFNRLSTGDWRYSYYFREGMQYTILDENLEVVDDSIATVSPLTDTDNHDFQVLPDGNYLLMSYEPTERDLTHLSFIKPGATEVEMEDSALQIVTPAGAATFDWNSWDHMAIEDCVTHYFPHDALKQVPPRILNRGDYAHVNSAQWVDGEIVASFRGCAKVLGIDATTGEVTWRVGGVSNLTDEQWAARGIGPAPLSIVKDPQGEFCGQHGANILPNGNLLLYDNGGACQINPWTLARTGRAGRDYSRAAEYALDFDNNEAVYLREHSIHGTKTRFAWSTGTVVPLDNGDWLISWGRVPRRAEPLDVTVTRVDPSTGVEKFEIGFTDAYLAHTPRGRINAETVPTEALAQRVVALTATVVDGDYTSAAFTGADDTPTVLVAFNRPVVDFDETSPSLSVTGATVAGVSARVVAGEAANAYLVTLTPDGEDTITVELLAGEACAGICAADGTQLSQALRHTIVLDRPPQITSGTQMEAAENTTAVATLLATDMDTATAALVWDIPQGAAGGADGDHFTLSASGRLAFGAVKDFEAPDDTGGDGIYEVTVRVSDATSSVTADLTVTLTDVDESPSVTASAGSSALVRFVENDTAAVGRYGAVDPEGETVQWRLSGRDSGRFAVTADQGDANVGILRFVSPPDYDAPADSDRDNGYEVTVEAFDTADNTGRLTVTVTVTDVNEAPVVSGDTTVTVTEGTTGVLARYGAVDPEGETVQWRLSGRDAAVFTATAGVLRFGSAPDFEAPADQGRDNGYEVTVQASDGALVGSVDVVVSVTNVDETGMVVLSSSQPQQDTELAATLSDPDGVTDNTTTWKWERSTDRSSYSEITSADTSSYTPVTADVNSYLRVTASYDDGHGTNKSVRAVSANRVRAAPVTNNAPVFASSETGQRSVAENTPAGRPVGAPVAATDPDAGDRLTYELTGTDAFSVDAATGQIRTLAPLDHEQRSSHVLVVVATDASNASAAQDVTIQVTDVNETPTVTGDNLLRIAENHAGSLHRYLADDPEGADVTWTLTGPDQGLFSITDAGVVTFVTPPDYDSPTDRGRNNTYDIVVNASDSTNTGRLEVTVTVTDVNEAPEVTGDTAVDFVERSTSPVARYQADDPEADRVQWSLAGRSADDFTIDDGILRFASAPNYDTDNPAGNTYEVTVQASDGLLSGSVTVTVTVTEATGFGGGGGGGGDAGDGGAPDVEAVPSAGFEDVDPESVHAANIDALFAAGITVGCSTETLRYCPDQPVTRAQMATFLVRALELPPAEPAGFEDVDPESVHAANIDALFAAGITVGCSTETLRYCPDQPVTRAQMATFLVRALELPPAPPAR